MDGTDETIHIDSIWKQIASGNLQYDSGNSNQRSVTTQRGGMGWEGSRREGQEGGDICIPMADTCLMYGRNQYDIVKQLSFNQKKHKITSLECSTLGKQNKIVPKNSPGVEIIFDFFF